MVDFTRPFPGKNPGDKITEQELISAIRLSLCAEEEATHLYDTIAEYTDDERVKKIMKDVADEEQVHIGEFQKLLDLLEDDEVEKVGEGEGEPEEKMSDEKPVEEGFNPKSLLQYITEDPDVISEGIRAGAHIDFDREDVAEFISRVSPEADVPEGHEYELDLFKMAVRKISPNAYVHESPGLAHARVGFEFLEDAREFIERIEELGFNVGR